MKSCNMKQTNIDVEVEKGGLEKKYVVVNSTSGFVSDEDPSEVEVMDDSTVETDVDSMSIQSDDDYDSDEEGKTISKFSQVLSHFVCVNFMTSLHHFSAVCLYVRNFFHQTSFFVTNFFRDCFSLIIHVHRR